MTRRIVLIRHCESTGLEPDAPLTGRGLAQADALAARLAPFQPDLIVSSPLRRARQTVDPLAAARGLTIEIDARFAERQLAAEPPADFRPAVRRSLEDFDHQMPGGESSRAAQARGRQAIEALLGRGARLPVVATHGQLLTLILNSIDPSFGFAGWESLSNPDVYLVEVDGAHWSFQRRGRAARSGNALRDGQYGNARNLDARVALHARFGISSQKWFPWVFDRLPRRERATILEIGCGHGLLWTQNRARVPPGWTVHLSDFSLGMLAQARRTLTGPAFRFLVADAQALPFSSGSFDCVIANHMLYHVPDRPRALAEIARLLKPDGCLIAATVGSRHLAEIDTLLADCGTPQAGLGHTTVTRFTLENGGGQLAQVFGEVALERYPAGLRVTEVEPVIAYVRSMPAGSGLAPAALDCIRAAVGRMIAEHGAFTVTSDSGLFVAR
jgi:broad specificity phosphatase PhoE